MPTVFEKLNWKPGLPVVALDAPESFLPELASIPRVSCTLHGASKIPFLIAFVADRVQVEEVARQLPRCLAADGILWFAYPKLTSKRYKSELNRDRGWQSLHDLGYDTVRAIAIDEDWSALRFRQSHCIGSPKRT